MDNCFHIYLPRPSNLSIMCRSGFPKLCKFCRCVLHGRFTPRLIWWNGVN